MVLDALNVGRIAMNEHSDKSMTKQLKQTVMDFVTKYGLLGFMTALPTTAQFMDYQAVYLPKNHFLKEETMPTNDYVDLFFPFSMPDFHKDERTAQWHVANQKRSAWHTDDVQFHADGRSEADTVLQAMHVAVFDQTPNSEFCSPKCKNQHNVEKSVKRSKCKK